MQLEVPCKNPFVKHPLDNSLGGHHRRLFIHVKQTQTLPKKPQDNVCHNAT